MFHDPLPPFYPQLGLLQKKSHFSQNYYFFFNFRFRRRINNFSSADLVPRDEIPITSVSYSYAGAVSNPSINSSPSSSYVFHKNCHNSNPVLSVSCANRSLSNPSSERISTILSSFRFYSDLFVLFIVKCRGSLLHLITLSDTHTHTQFDRTTL
jgi:hypothetical protein